MSQSKEGSRAELVKDVSRDLRDQPATQSQSLITSKLVTLFYILEPSQENSPGVVQLGKTDSGFGELE